MSQAIVLYIVEDNDDDAKLLSDTCKREKWLDISIYGNTEDAVRRTKRQPPDVLSLDLLFGDAFLGFWALQKTRSIDPSVGVVVVSEFRGKREEAAEREIDSFITKPQVKADPSIYLSAVRRAERRRIQSSIE